MWSKHAWCWYVKSPAQIMLSGITGINSSWKDRQTDRQLTTLRRPQKWLWEKPLYYQHPSMFQSATATALYTTPALITMNVAKRAQSSALPWPKWILFFHWLYFECGQNSHWLWSTCIYIYMINSYKHGYFVLNISIMFVSENHKHFILFMNFLLLIFFLWINYLLPNSVV